LMKMMKVVVLVAVVVACVVAAADEEPTVSLSMIREINRVQNTWRAGVNKLTVQPKSVTHGLLGVTLDAFKQQQKTVEALPKPMKPDLLIPESFDVRDQWPKCKEVVGSIRDQGNCGSCWAFGAAEVMSDRECIHNNIIRFYSTQDITGCANDSWAPCGGCTGGLPWCAFKYWNLYGVVSEECAPYNVTGGKTPECIERCLPTYTHMWSQDKMFGATHELFVGEEQMQEELMKNGSIESMMVVYDDLYAYKSGIYKHTTGSMSAAHAVKIVGWGVEDGVKYWTIANSWGTDWGENGFFRMLRGAQECGIETSAFAGVPRKQ